MSSGYGVAMEIGHGVACLRVLGMLEDGSAKAREGNVETGRSYLTADDQKELSRDSRNILDKVRIVLGCLGNSSVSWHN